MHWPEDQQWYRGIVEEVILAMLTVRINCSRRCAQARGPWVGCLLTPSGLGTPQVSTQDSTAYLHYPDTDEYEDIDLDELIEAKQIAFSKSVGMQGGSVSVINAELWTSSPFFLHFAVETRSIYTKLKHDEIPVNAADGPIVIYEDRRDSDVSTEPSSDEADEEDHVIEVDDIEKPSRENHKQVGRGKPHAPLSLLHAREVPALRDLFRALCATIQLLSTLQLQVQRSKRPREGSDKPDRQGTQAVGPLLALRHRWTGRVMPGLAVAWCPWVAVYAGGRRFLVITPCFISCLLQYSGCWAGRRHGGGRSLAKHTHYATSCKRPALSH